MYHDFIIGGVVSRHRTINAILVKMCEKGVSGGGTVNIKDPLPLYVMYYEWGGEV
jgi:hypothetical protein